MAEVTITATEKYEMHNNAYDEAQIAFDEKLALWRHEVDAVYTKVRESDPEADLTEVDVSHLEQPVREDVPQTVSAQKVFFKEGDDDERGLFVCVLADASIEEIGDAIRARLAEAVPVSDMLAAGDTLTI